MIERVREDTHLLRRVPVLVDSRMQVSRVHARGDAGHPPQRRREARADQVRRAQCAHEHENPSEDEGARDPGLGALDAREGLAHAKDDGVTRDRGAPLEKAQVADVRKLHRRVTDSGPKELRRRTVLAFLFRERLTGVRARVGREELRLVGRGPRAGDEREQQRRAAVVWLVAHVALRLRPQFRG